MGSRCAGYVSGLYGIGRNLWPSGGVVYGVDAQLCLERNDQLLTALRGRDDPGWDQAPGGERQSLGHIPERRVIGDGAHSVGLLWRGRTLAKRSPGAILIVARLHRRPPADALETVSMGPAADGAVRREQTRSVDGTGLAVRCFWRGHVEHSDNICGRLIGWVVLGGRDRVLHDGQPDHHRHRGSSPAPGRYVLRVRTCWRVSWT